ncbi:MAG: SLBB domain-containing protein, partial [Bacteroidales bacterium]|nr:SLBB domain-containing protein [Bacteroidales bacterium]
MRIFLFLMVWFLVLGGVTRGQNINPASVDVSALSEGQIQTLILEMQKRGMTEEQALALARAKGVSEEQIDLLRQRILSVSSNQDISRSSESGLDLDQGFSSDFLFGGASQFSEKAFFIATQEEERLFGFQLFNSANLSFETGANYPVTDAYQIGVGDEFRIDVYGVSQQSYVAIVDQNGQIRIPNVGPVAVGGRQLGTARAMIKEKLALIYRDLESDPPRTFVNIHLGSIQPITVNVIGEVFSPGTFNLPGTATAFNALYLSGGPNIRGSFRDIQVIRNGRVIHRLDVYEYIINGDGSVNIALNDGDVIMVPTYSRRVRVGGELIRSGIFESKAGETLAELIDFAGGFNEMAYSKRVELYRNDGRERVMKDVLPDSFAETQLQNGDSIYVGKVLDRFSNRISINGAVFRPGTYELSENMMLSDLIARADGVREDAFVERGLILRRNQDLTLTNVSFNVSEIVSGVSDIALQREDVVSISSIDDMREQRNIR